MTRKDANRIARAISSVRFLPGADRDTVIAIAQAVAGEFAEEKAFFGFESSATALHTNISFRRKLSEPRPNKALELLERMLADGHITDELYLGEALKISRAANIEARELAELSPTGGA